MNFSVNVDPPHDFRVVRQENMVMGRVRLGNIIIVLARTSSNLPDPTQCQSIETREAHCCTLLYFGPFCPQRGCTKLIDRRRLAAGHNLAGQH
jgi:hypothetical protein